MLKFWGWYEIDLGFFFPTTLRQEIRPTLYPPLPHLLQLVMDFYIWPPRLTLIAIDLTREVGPSTHQVLPNSYNWFYAQGSWSGGDKNTVAMGKEIVLISVALPH